MNVNAESLQAEKSGLQRKGREAGSGSIGGDSDFLKVCVYGCNVVCPHGAATAHTVTGVQLRPHTSAGSAGGE